MYVKGFSVRLSKGRISFLLGVMAACVQLELICLSMSKNRAGKEQFLSVIKLEGVHFSVMVWG